MKPIIIDMKDMSDSTEVYTSRPHPFFVVFIYLILGIIVTSFVWMNFWKMEVVVKSNGTFKMAETTGNVSSSVTGKVSECNLQEGEYVSEGDILFSIDHSEASKNLETYEESLADISDRITIMNAYLKYLYGNKGNMDTLADNKYYSEFIDRGKLISTNIDATNNNVGNQILQYRQSITSINSSINYYQLQKNNYEKALEDVKALDNTFEENEVYFYTLVENYISGYNITALQYDEKIKQYEKERESAAELLKTSYDETIKNVQEEKEKALNNLQFEQISSIEQQIETVKGTVITLNGNLESANAQLSVAQNGTNELTNEAIILTEKNAINSEILTYESKKAEYENDIQAIKESIAKYEVKASISGYISMLSEIQAGNYVQEGTTVCQIIPESSETYYAEIYVSNQDIGKIIKDQEVKFEITAYPSSEYGYFSGVVETISKDVKIDSNTRSAYYLVKAKCDKTTLHNKKGDSVSILNGMACQAKIVTDEQSVLEYVLRKIDMID